MNREQEQVKDFHEKAGATINSHPTDLDKRDYYLRLGLIFEELNELAESFGFEYDHTEHTKFIHSRPTRSFAEQADALGDLLYVVLGTAVSCGIHIDPIFQEIHRSNMTKFIDGHRDPKGKWIKGPSYSPANLQPILDIQTGNKFDKPCQ